MNTYDDLVNDYLRAVEQALAGVPANRRAELLADLSEHIAAKRAELSPEEETEVEVRSILDLLGDPEEVAAEALLDYDQALPTREAATLAAVPSAAAAAAAAPFPRHAPAPPVLIQPQKRSAALIWVGLTIAAVAGMCVVAGLLGVFLLARNTSSGGDSPAEPAPVITTPPPAQSSSTPSASPS